MIGNCPKHPDSIIHARGVCRRCYRKIHYEERERDRRGNKKHEKYPLYTTKVDKSGYVRIKIGEGKGARDWVKHHRYVMELKLGRKLESYENVHHKNGNRQDNSEPNLELWITYQPKGQKVEDLIEYAEFILKTYKKE